MLKQNNITLGFAYRKVRADRSRVRQQTNGKASGCQDPMLWNTAVKLSDFHDRMQDAADRAVGKGMLTDRPGNTKYQDVTVTASLD